MASLVSVSSTSEYLLTNLALAASLREKLSVSVDRVVTSAEYWSRMAMRRSRPISFANYCITDSIWAVFLTVPWGTAGSYLIGVALTVLLRRLTAFVGESCLWRALKLVVTLIR